MRERDFRKELDFFLEKIKRKEPFAFARYADGEAMIMNSVGINGGTQALDVDKWSFNPQNQVFSKDLITTLFHTEKNYFYAIACPCCNFPVSEFYRKNLKCSEEEMTWSNLWINSNYESFIDFVKTLDRKVNLLINYEGEDKEFPFEIDTFFSIPDDCVNWYEKNREWILQKMKEISKEDGQIFFVSAGPLSEILIHEMYMNNPNNQYIDTGSSLDIFVKGRITRPYQGEGSNFKKQKCNW